MTRRGRLVTGRRFATGLLLATVAAITAGDQPRSRAAATVPAGDDAQRAVSFTREIRPIFADNCYACHGPDAKQVKADLRLDQKDSVFGVLKSGSRAVVPGKPAESSLLERITEPDDDRRMPPASTGKRVTAEQVALVRRWIDQGARWQSHWAYEPLTRTAPASFGGDGRSDGFIRNDIDRFVVAELRELKLKPAAESDRVTLVRRLYFDLLGLPPSPADVDAFVADTAEQAYERLVDRVLAAPQFGERLAMYWLDLVRYGDTNGYHADVHRNVFPYRDYVIAAFNSNKSFDQFTIEQLAGDLLPGATIEQRVASGYNRMNMITTEGGAQAKEYLGKYAADRVRNASTVWLASTMGCSECHDHKFDPFTTRDFYRFAAFFADVKQVGVYPNKVDIEPQLQVPTPEQSAELDRLDSRIAALRHTLDTQTPELDADQRDWEQSLESTRIGWTVLVPRSMASRSGTTLETHDDGTILATGDSPDADVYTLNVETDLNGITAIKLDVLADDSLPRRGPGRADNGNFVLSHLAVEALAPGNDEPRAVVLQNATATFEQKGGNLSVAGAIDAAKKDAKSGWAVADRIGQSHEAIFETKDDVVASDTVRLNIALHQTHGGKHTIGRFRLSATTAARPLPAGSSTIRGMPDSIAAIAATDAGMRTDEQKEQLSAHFRGVAPALAPARREFDELRKQRDALDKSIPATLVTVSAEPLTMRVLPRGNWLDESGDVVLPGVPHFLPQPTRKAAEASNGNSESCSTTRGVPDAADPERRLTRLDLAEWLVSRDRGASGLTARVFVNRLWKMLFGQGLVRTTDDFGSQGAPATHPELLDWLAGQFIDSGWDVKHTIKLIAMSGTYRQSSFAGPERRRVDPYNLWLARQGRFRLDAETIRDNALAVSGLLSPKIGGRSVKPYQPDGYWDHCNTFQGKLIYDQDHGDDLYRRGLYSYWKRTFLHPAMLAFDAPSREECTTERPRSNTPLQALVLLNDPTFVEAARVFAERIVRDGGATTELRLAFAFRRALSRPARPEELKLLAATLDQHLTQFRADAAAANELVRVGEWPVPADIDAAELAAWTSVARVILNLHETMTRN